ncbi:Uncharacterised protein [Streptococcus pneumoniae]|nr:Uncharacterised protein [Streptococcus pneumoniae]CGF66892.1 Uncharacterised protein [Streptococcus pneumoniae]CGG15012.1 Uncharacterised protein [Streptococcus pneumoniae]CGG51605.1 Uncharacterised protein [Streptococcus pneumoniae]CIO73264.1 Uncharacterised protein [Streptococcus pneumoniae]
MIATVTKNDLVALGFSEEHLNVLSAKGKSY